MKYHKLFIWFALSGLFLLASCSKEAFETTPVADGEVTVLFSFSAPGNTVSKTRAVDENAVQNVEVLIFEEQGGEYRYQYRVRGYALTATGARDYHFKARIVASDIPTKIYLVANYADGLDAIQQYDSEAVVKTRLNEAYTVAGPDGALPMFGQVTFANGLTENRQMSTVLVRSLARADIVNLAQGFTMHSVQAYRVNPAYQVLPDQLDGTKVTAPSLPAGMSSTINTPAMAIGSGQVVERQIYLPEAAAVAEADLRLKPTVLVVAGSLEGSGEITYYRLDFAPDNTTGQVGQILRNHLYQFQILEVAGPGWRSPDEAAHNLTSNISVMIEDWDESTLDMYFDGIHHFGIESREITLAYLRGDVRTLSVDTDLEEYSMVWNHDPSQAQIGWGDSSEDPDGLFRVEVSGDGKQLKFATLANNHTNDLFTRQLTISAGRMRITVTVNQRPPVYSNRAVSFYGYNLDLARFGDDMFGGLGADRPLAMRQILKNTANFGPSGTIKCGGFTFGGSTSPNVHATVPEIFDIIYLPYPANPDAASVEVVRDVIENRQDKVVIITHDNLATNQRLMAALGITVQRPLVLRPFVVHPDAPEEIMSGPFGDVDPSASLRCNDDTYGEIPMDVARANNITPILVGSTTGNVVLGVDLDRHVVYVGEIDFFYANQGATQGQFVRTGGGVNNDIEKLLANLFAWMSRIVLAE